MPLFKRRIKVSKEEFAKVLLVWLIRCLSEEEIQQIAQDYNLAEDEDALKLFGLDIENSESLEGLLQELFAFNMWSIVVSCETQIENKNVRNECLDIFHILVFKEYLGIQEQDCSQWGLAMGEVYQEYNEALQKGGQLGPVYGLATLLNMKLYGKLNLDAFVQAKIGHYISSSIEAVQGLIKNYDIK